MFLIKGGRSETGERHHVFVEARPPVSAIPPGWKVVENVTLTAYPLPDDPNAPTVRVVLYRDPVAPNQYHYLLPGSAARHLRRAGGTPFVFPSWEEFTRVHPHVLSDADD
jgi:hypothetical protein